MKNWLLLTLLPLCFYAIAQPQVSNSQVNKIFAKWDRTDSPGCALTVIKDGTIIYKRGYGLADLEHRIPNSPETVFYIGSVSKQFVTMCVLLMEEQGLISLDDDVHKYFPELPDYGHPITIRNLIHHTSGIRDYLTLWHLAGHNYLDDMDEQVVYDLICRQKELNFEPGTKYLYSNSCYFMMAMLVQKVTGKPISQFGKEEIFDPLGMSQTQFYDDNRKLIPNRAFGYSSNPEGGFYNMMMRFDLVGSGGIYSSVEDLYKWDQNFYDNKLGKGRQELIELMHTNGKYKDGTEVDYAFALVNDTYRGLSTVSHGGALGGYRSHYLRFPEQSFTVIILSNLANLGPGARAYEVADVFLKDMFTEALSEKENRVGSNGSAPEAPKAQKVAEKTAKAMVGRYYSAEIDATYNLLWEEGNMYVQVQNGPKEPLPQLDELTFGSGPYQMRMQKDFKGFELDAGRVKNLKFERQ